MGFWGFGKKVDKTLNPYIKLNSKRKIPVIIYYSGSGKLVRNKIISNNGKIKYEYENITAFSCELSPLTIDRLSEIPEVSYICFDYKATLCIRKSSDTLGLSYAKLFNLTGRNIGIGIIDSGVYPHPDLMHRRRTIHFFQDLINEYDKPYDDNGHGTFLCGCIAASGYSSDGLYSGIAPDCNLSMIKAFDASGNGFISDIIKGIDILIAKREEKSIKIICLPFEIANLGSLKINPLEEIIKKAFALNITLIVPSGNQGPHPYSIYCPGDIKEVVTVGGIDNTCINVKNYKIPGFSGRGPTMEGFQKPDICAPCLSITSLAADTSYHPGLKKIIDLKNAYSIKSGTSASCAIMCGFAALILEKNPALEPKDLKSILCLSTISIGEGKYSQGNGLFIFDKIAK
jgi:serine protease AprX